MKPSTLALEDGAKIVYCVFERDCKDFSDESVITILCFNGAFFNILLWEEWVNRLLKEWRVPGVGLRIVLHDVRGSGEGQPSPNNKTDGRDQFTFDTYVDDAKFLLCHLNVKRNIISCGMAWGSRPAFVFATRFPEIVSGLILYDFSIGVSTTKEWSGAQKYGAKLAQEKRERLGIIEPIPDSKRITSHRDRQDCMKAMSATSKPKYGSPKNFADAVGLSSTAPLGYPVLIAVGEFDPNLIASPGGSKEIVQQLRLRQPSTELSILDATGHASVKGRPWLCASVAYDWIHRHVRVDNVNNCMSNL